MKLRVLDLFSGIGGFSLGLERTGGFETVAFCEIEEFPRKVLRKHWPDVPIFEDVRNLRGDDVGTVDVICGGYPCQPFSTAGRRRGAEDDRHLWPEFNRLVAELRPAWVIGENVAGHISMGLDQVLSDLEGQGYACRTFVIPACAVDAPHRRDRCWTIGHRDREPVGTLNAEAQELQVVGNAVQLGDWEFAKPSELRVARNEFLPKKRQQGSDKPVGPGSHVAHARGSGQSEQRTHRYASNQAARSERKAAQPFDGGFRSIWEPEPSVGRVANGVPRRVDRLKGLGNAVVPQIPEIIGHAILEAKRANMMGAAE